MIRHETLGRWFSSERFKKFIKWYAFRTPFYHLYEEPGGEMYMARWRVVDEGSLGGLLLRLFTGYSSCRLHHIRRPDQDRALHDHPFTYRTFILEGFYVEELSEADSRSHSRSLFAGNTGTGCSGKFHRISFVPQEGTWTLFFMTKNTSRWGFMTEGAGFVNSVKYFLRCGKSREFVRNVNQL